MAEQRTAPVIPFLRYRDAPAAIEFLKDAFGFAEQMVVPGEGNVIEHAQLRFGSSVIMLGTLRAGDPVTQRGRPDPTQGLYVIVDDPDAHYARAKAAGAEIAYALSDQDYGSREYGAYDPEGYYWSFGTYRAEPED